MRRNFNPKRVPTSVQVHEAVVVSALLCLLDCCKLHCIHCICILDCMYLNFWVKKVKESKGCFHILIHHSIGLGQISYCQIVKI